MNADVLVVKKDPSKRAQGTKIKARREETASQRQSARDAAIKAAKAELAKRKKGKKGGRRK